MRKHADGVAEHHGDLLADEVGDCERGAAIGHMRHLEAGPAAEELGDEMIGGADAGGAVVHRFRLAPGQSHEVSQRFDRQLGIDHQDVRVGGGHGDRREIPDGIVMQVLVDGRIDGDRAGLAEQERVAVGFRLRHHLGAEDRACAAAVLDHDRLADRFPDALGDDARHRIRAAARRIGNDELDRPRRIIVGADGGDRERASGGQSQSPRPNGASPHRRHFVSSREHFFSVSARLSDREGWCSHTSFAISRSLNFWILPVEVFGNSAKTI